MESSRARGIDDAAAVLLAAAVLVGAGCDAVGGRACVAGTVEGCSCAEGVGTRQCQSDGAGWEPCECPGADGDADADVDLDGDTDRDADLDADLDEGGPVGGGELTKVISDMSVIVERLFDIDGDGELDNAVADLGADNAAVFALMLNSLLDSSSSTEGRQLIHFPWVEDLGTFTDPSLTLISLTGRDLDLPLDLTDDYSGTEPFHARYGSLDACGEPRYYAREASFDAGELEVTGGTFAVGARDAKMVIRYAVGVGTFSHGGSNEAIIGGALLATDLGAARAPAVSDDLNMLEVLLAGGAIMGIEALPGLRLDLDLDGDGLEIFDVDEGSQILRCIDGDHTVIDGRDCWQDSRIADALSVTLGFELVGAVYEGREPGWEHLVEGECTDPPEESLFDPR